MPWLFFYSALSIPLFYAAGMAFWKDVNFTVMEFWRFWVVHLWVEDFLELFTTIMVAYLFVLLGVVRLTVATRIVYLDIILYSIGGVVGTLQLYDAVANGYWHAREPEFFQNGLVHLFEWLRITGDTLFIVGGILPVVYLAYLMFRYRNRGERPADGEAEAFTA